MNRAADVIGAGLGLALASPLLAAAAVAIKLEDGGPVLYRQRRVGQRGEEFDLLKLRTMVVGAERLGEGLAVNRGDARITRVGRFLRRTSLDELPQLWNVVRGEMSLIGPRPTLAYQVERYTERERRAQQNLYVEPGRAVLDVPHVELDPVGPRQRRPPVDLRPARDPRPHLQTPALALRIALDLVGQCGPRPDQAHLAADDVPELR